MIICKNCNTVNQDEGISCQRCGERLVAKNIELDVSSTSNLPIAPDQVISAIIFEHVKAGFQVLSQTPTTAQLFRKKGFSTGKAIAFGLLYLASHAGKKDDLIFVNVNPDGSYQLTDQKGFIRVFQPGEAFYFHE